MYSCRCIFSFVMMCALVYHFAIRNHLKFKLHLNSNRFVFKKMELGKVFLFLLAVWAEIRQRPSQPPPLLFCMQPS
jgi:hypothetical protein